LTVTLVRPAELCLSSGGTIAIGTNVCDRGTNPVPDGARAVFCQGDPSASGGVACETGLPILLTPAACTEVTCDWSVPSGQSINEVSVLVDPDGEVAKCHNGNNGGAVAAILCLDYFN